MAKRRETGGVRKRGAVWWIYYRVAGHQYDESAETGDERAARSLLTQRRREIRDGSWKAPTDRAAVRRIEDARRELADALAAAPESAPLTLKAYLDDWITRRRAADVSKAEDEARYFEVYVVPHVTNPTEVALGATPIALGDLALVDVKRAHMRALMTQVALAKTEKKKEPLAPRTVLHVYRTLATAFADAQADELIAASPCTLRTRKGELPVKRDKNPRWRAESVFARDELETTISDLRIPLDRRVYYALGGLAGLRSSEIAATPWRAYDGAAQPLGRLTVATQAEDGETEGDTKTGEIRDVPVVPALAALLAEWKLHGFPKLFGWHPRPDDPIVPSRVSRRDAVRFRSKKMLESLHEDLARVSIRKIPAPRHALRATFLSLLEVDGANMAIARRATHAAPTDVVGGYIRLRWEDVCREVAKLRIDVRRVAKVHAIARAQNDIGPADSVADSRAGSGVSAMLSERGGRDSNGSALSDSATFRRSDADSHARQGPQNTGPRSIETQPLTHVSAARVREAIDVLRAAGRSDLADAVAELVAGPK